MARRIVAFSIGLALVGSFICGGATQPAALRALMLMSSVALGAAALAGPIRCTASTSVCALLLGCTLVGLPTTHDVGATLLCAGRWAALLAFAPALDVLAAGALPELLLTLLVIAVAIPMLSLAGHLPMPLSAALPTRAVVESPLQNPNHLGALVSALQPLAWMRLRRASPRGRAALVVLIVASNVTLWGTHSRGALLGGLLGQLATIAWTLGPRLRRARLAAAAIVVLTASIGLAAEVLRRGPLLAWTDESRLRTWRDALPLLRDHAALGVGPGAFALVFTRYGSIAGRIRHAFVENQYLQVALDHGLILGSVLGIALVMVALRSANDVQLDSPTTRAALVGVVVIALHEVADFATWGGTVALATISLTTLATRNGGPVLRRAVALPLVLLPLLLCVASIARPTPLEDLSTLEHALARELDANAIDALGHRALARHPDDGEIALDLAARQLVHSPARALPWIEKALVLAPRDPRAHLGAARSLQLAGFSAQAAGELRAAARGAGDPERRILAALAQHMFDDHPELLARALPSDEPQVVAEVAAGFVAAGRADAARAVLDPALEDRDPALAASDGRTLLRLRVEAGLALHERVEPSVERFELLIDSNADRLFAAHAWLALGRADRALSLLRVVLSTDDEPSRTKAALAISQQMARGGDPKAARDVVDAEQARAVDVDHKAVLLERLAELDDAAGRRSLAAVERADAARLKR